MARHYAGWRKSGWTSLSRIARQAVLLRARFPVWHLAGPPVGAAGEALAQIRLPLALGFFVRLACMIVAFMLIPRSRVDITADSVIARSHSGTIIAYPLAIVRSIETDRHGLVLQRYFGPAVPLPSVRTGVFASRRSTAALLNGALENAKAESVMAG